MNLIQQTLQFIFGVSILTKSIWMELWSKPFHLRLTLNQIYEIGYKSWPIIFVTAASTGLVLSLQFGFTLEKYGLKMYTPRLISIALFREIAPVFTAFVLAGRVGAGMTAEISSMKVTQQIDAMRALGSSPIKLIVIPRVLGSVFSIPFLTLFSCAVSYVFSAFTSAYQLNITVGMFTSYFFNKILLLDFLSGFIKTFVFAYLIAISACYFGMSASQKREGVGEVTTLAVVSSSVMIVTSDFVLTWLFFLLWLK